jgi:hypothetical protein
MIAKVKRKKNAISDRPDAKKCDQRSQKSGVKIAEHSAISDRKARCTSNAISDRNLSFVVLFIIVTSSSPATSSDQ